jgi:hypothetical protein
MGIAVVFPGGGFVDEGLLVGNAAVKALGGKNAEFGFRQIEPCMDGARGARGI